MNNSEWVDRLILAMRGSVGKNLTITIGGQNVTAFITQDALNFFLQNQIVLAEMGKQAFVDFMSLTNQGKQDAAFELMLKSMTASDIIAQMQMTHDELKAWNDAKAKFISSLENFALTTLTPQLLKILVGLLVA